MKKNLKITLDGFSKDYIDDDFDSINDNAALAIYILQSKIRIYCPNHKWSTVIAIKNDYAAQCKCENCGETVNSNNYIICSKSCEEFKMSQALE